MYGCSEALFGGPFQALCQFVNRLVARQTVNQYDSGHMANRFVFEPEKALETIVYIARRIPSPTFHSISKVLYFADQKHLSEYGRLICGDSYVAMKHGPVPSGVYDILRADQGNGWPIKPGLRDRLTQAFTAEGCKVTANRDADFGELSDSDREALDWSISSYGNMNFQQRSSASHDAAWQSADENDLISLEAIVDLQDNADELRQHLELGDH